MKAKFILVKNALANVVRGSSAAIVAILLPPFLTRLMSADAYGAWCLVLQISAYVGYLDFGIQTAVGRFVARANETGDTEHKGRIVNTSLAGLSAAGLFGFCGMATIAFLMPNVFPRLPRYLIADARIALLLVGSSLAVGLPSSVFNGIFIGLQRYEVPAAIIGGSRITGGILLVFVVKHGGGLARMGVVMAAVNLLSYGLQYLAYRKLTSTVRLSTRLVSRQAVRELFDYCLSLSIWSFAMLLVSGLDVLLVGYYQFEAVAYYAVAATLITFLAGLQNAVVGVMVPSTAALHARRDFDGLGRGLITATRYGFFLLLLTGLPLLLAAKGVLTLWVGASYAEHGARILRVLVAANIIRLSAAPYVMTLIGTGQQRLVTITPLLEGFCNVFASVIGGYLFGAMGVAIGTLVGSLAGMGGHFVYNMPRTREIEFSVSDYLRDGMLRPAICAIPLIACAIMFNGNIEFAPAFRYLGLAATLTATVLLVWRWGLVGSERAKLRMWRLAVQV
jgi:O-antigen/teichoic acid export membrane protein